MTVYFYHTQDLNYIQKEWEAGRFPSHLLYGASQLKNEGIDVIFHKYTDPVLPRWKRCADVARKVLKDSKRFDAVYATKQNGLDLVILLRALGLFRKPVIIWHHQPIMPQTNPLKRLAAKLYYKGIDHMFMFSESIVKTSAESCIFPSSKMQQCPWGADLAYYYALMEQNPVPTHQGFISTGKERRDMATLLAAFQSNPSAKLTLITAQSCCDTDYERFFAQRTLPTNVSLILNKTMWIPEISKLIWPNACVCICCEKTNYTVGLTTLIEAMALGLPIIVTKNETLPLDVSELGCGISVDYYDIQGWTNAVKFIFENPDEARKMGRRSLELAQKTYNIENCASIVAARLKTFIA